jgi:hypothetical protein
VSASAPHPIPSPSPPGLRALPSSPASSAPAQPPPQPNHLFPPNPRHLQSVHPARAAAPVHRPGPGPGPRPARAGAGPGRGSGGAGPGRGRGREETAGPRGGVRGRLLAGARTLRAGGSGTGMRIGGTTMVVAARAQRCAATATAVMWTTHGS